jgi:hypothetical protein
VSAPRKAQTGWLREGGQYPEAADQTLQLKPLETRLSVPAKLLWTVRVIARLRGTKDGIIAAVTYLEGGAGSDAARYSVDRALNGGLLAMLYVEDPSAVA